MERKDKRERFKRLATQRTKNVLKSLKVLENCANSSAYEYSDKEIGAIFEAIDKQVKAIKNRFQSSTHEKVDFRL